MTQINSQQISSNDFFSISVVDNAIVIEFFKDNNVLSSSWLNGGYQENIKYVINQSLEPDDYIVMESMDFDSFQENYMNKIGCDPSKSSGLLTSACMDNYYVSCYSYEDLSVTSVVTGGADKNGCKAGDPARFYEHNNKYSQTAGTINIFVIIDANLEAGALVTASITATEAKTSVLEDLKLESQYSTNIATGTGTDGICIISNKSSDNHIENAGKHSKLGELIAKSVQDAIRVAIKLQTAMCREYQKTVLSRLTRFNVDFETLFSNTSNISRVDYASLLYPYSNDTNNISWISMVINLVDEYQAGLLTMDEVVKPIRKTIKTFTGYDSNRNLDSVDEIIEYIITAINYDLLKKD